MIPETVKPLALFRTEITSPVLPDWSAMPKAVIRSPPSS
jgi:hypothetical protein